MIKDAIASVLSGQSLTEPEMAVVVDHLMSGNCKDEEVAELLTALHRKGETVDELAGAARALRGHMNPITSSRTNLIDTCGTGGGKSGTFNISTAAALVAASAGAAVAKHGNRASTSKTGSADVLQELGVKIDCSLQTVHDCLAQLGICFCFAPLFHPSVRHVMNVRRSLPHPTIFNLLGPLCNPANSPFQLLGAGRGETRQLIASALAKLGTTRSFVVHGRDGVGEISNTTITDVSRIEAGKVSEAELEPSDFGLEATTFEPLKVDSPAESAAVINAVLAGDSGPCREVVVLNAATALWITGVVSDPKSGVARCESAIDSGDARKLLAELVKITNN